MSVILSEFNQKKFNTLFGNGKQKSEFVNQQDEYGNTGLIWAIRNGKYKYAERLFDANIDTIDVSLVEECNDMNACEYILNKKYIDKWTSLLIKMINHKTFDFKKEVFFSYDLADEFKLYYGRNVNIIFLFIHRALLNRSFYPVLCEFINKENAQINSFRESELSLFGYLLTRDNCNKKMALDICKKLLERNDLDLGKVLAFGKMNLLVVNELIANNKFAINKHTDGLGDTILFSLIRKNIESKNEELYKSIIMSIISKNIFDINKKDFRDRSYLHIASACGNTFVVDQLLKHPSIQIDA